MTHLPTDCFTEVLSEEETRVSALLDGESALSSMGLEGDVNVVHQYYHYQLIRQTLRGVAMTAGAHESIAWNKSRFVQLWARVDAQTDGQTH